MHTWELLGKLWRVYLFCVLAYVSNIKSTGVNCLQDYIQHALLIYYEGCCALAEMQQITTIRISLRPTRCSQGTSTAWLCAMQGAPDLCDEAQRQGGTRPTAFKPHHLISLTSTFVGGCVPIPLFDLAAA